MKINARRRQTSTSTSAFRVRAASVLGAQGTSASVRLSEASCESLNRIGIAPSLLYNFNPDTTIFGVNCSVMKAVMFFRVPNTIFVWAGCSLCTFIMSVREENVRIC